MVTMVFLAVSLISLASVMCWASSNGKVTQQNELFTTAEAATGLVYKPGFIPAGTFVRAGYQR